MGFGGRGPKAIAVGAVTAAFAGGAAVAAADPGGDTLYVSHTATPARADTSCATAAYSSVQAAVDAAHPGQTVYLCGAVPYENGITVDDPGSRGEIRSSTIDGGGPNAQIARNGIQISRGADRPGP